ncbi:MAG: hypothetical protein DWQ05_07290 [Calditrichaeota bacterium]|nr:MAG: hypothetical protein DWQ05_07290 [Calditrichota bacterium]
MFAIIHRDELNKNYEWKNSLRILAKCIQFVSSCQENKLIFSVYITRFDLLILRASLKLCASSARLSVNAIKNKDAMQILN